MRARCAHLTAEDSNRRYHPMCHVIISSNVQYASFARSFCRPTVVFPTCLDGRRTGQGKARQSANLASQPRVPFSKNRAIQSPNPLASRANVTTPRRATRPGIGARLGVRSGRGGPVRNASVPSGALTVRVQIIPLLPFSVPGGSQETPPFYGKV
jgi:hypothetical protein